MNVLVNRRWFWHGNSKETSFHRNSWHYNFDFPFDMPPNRLENSSKSTTLIVNHSPWLNYYAFIARSHTKHYLPQITSPSRYIIIVTNNILFPHIAQQIIHQFIRERKSEMRRTWKCHVSEIFSDAAILPSLNHISRHPVRNKSRIIKRSADLPSVMARPRFLYYRESKKLERNFTAAICHIQEAR